MGKKQIRFVHKEVGHDKSEAVAVRTSAHVRMHYVCAVFDVYMRIYIYIYMLYLYCVPRCIYLFMDIYIHYKDAYL